MQLRNTTSTLLAMACALLACGGACAQRPMYRCSVNGQISLADRPCGDKPATGLAVIGPSREARAAVRTNDTSVAKAADFLSYLSPQCAELNEGIRNGSARGIGARTMSELRSSYRERCGEDEQEARKKLADDQAKKRVARNDELAAEKSERDRQRLSREQCDEMYRIVHGRRQRLASMSAGERADFDHFEANWKARCQPS